jgi:hypothetical protein
MTIAGGLAYKRLALTPATSADAERLKAAKNGAKMVFPLDEVFGLDVLPYKMTVRTMLEIAYWAKETCSFDAAEKALFRNTAIRVNAETIRAVVNTVGKIVFQNDVLEADRIYGILQSGRLRFPKIKHNHVLYLEVDGAMIHTRLRDDNGCLWKENKLGMAFSNKYFTYWCNKKGERQHKIGLREYVSYLGDVVNFKKLMFSMAIRNGYGEHKHTILLSDGATWIRNMHDELFPDTQQILDFFHLCENISNFAKSIFKLVEKKYKPWVENTSKLFKESKTKDAIKEISKLKNYSTYRTSPDLLGYVENNIKNIDYALYIKNGWFIGSGAIESANRTVLQRRLKQPGMRWNIESGQNLLTLMAKDKSGRWTLEVVRPVLSYFKAENGYIDMG